jgi:predicted ATPase
VADYIAVAKNYHTVFISEVPVMSMKIRDKVCLPTILDKPGLL